MFIEEELKTPIKDEYDVIVVGAGPAGCGTAIALGRSGLKTLLIEKFNCLGGAWTTGFMNTFFDCYGKTGFVKELVDELKKEGQFGGFWDISFNYEYMKYILEKKMKEAGVDILYNTVFSKTLVEERKAQADSVYARALEIKYAILGNAKEEEARKTVFTDDLLDDVHGDRITKRVERTPVVFRAV